MNKKETFILVNLHFKNSNKKNKKKADNPKEKLDSRLEQALLLSG